MIVVYIGLFSCITLLSDFGISIFCFRMMETFIKNLSAHVLQNEMPYVFAVCSCCRNFSVETEACILVRAVWSASEEKHCASAPMPQSSLEFWLQAPANKFYCSAFPLFLPQLLTSQPASITPLQVWSVGGNNSLGCSGRTRVKWILLDFASSWAMVHLDSIPH